LFDPRDEYIQKWLVGINFHIFHRAIHNSNFFFVFSYFECRHSTKSARSYNINEAEKMLRAVSIFKHIL
jgi:hypothetical protein